MPMLDGFNMGVGGDDVLPAPSWLQSTGIRQRRPRLPPRLEKHGRLFNHTRRPHFG